MQSQAAQHFNQKIYILLTLQTIFPIVFNSSPVVITFVCAAMRWFVGDCLLITGALLSFAQVLDPICIMMMVNDYKKAIMKGLVLPCQLHIPDDAGSVCWLKGLNIDYV